MNDRYHFPQGADSPQVLTPREALERATEDTAALFSVVITTEMLNRMLNGDMLYFGIAVNEYGVAVAFDEAAQKMIEIAQEPAP